MVKTIISLENILERGFFIYIKYFYAILKLIKTTNMGHYSAEMGLSPDYLKAQKIMFVCDHFRYNFWEPKIGDKVKLISIDLMKIILTNKGIKPYLQLVDVKLEIASIKNDKFFLKVILIRKMDF